MFTCVSIVHTMYFITFEGVYLCTVFTCVQVLTCVVYLCDSLPV